MTLAEAHNTGRKYRRINNGGRRIDYFKYNINCETLMSALADDWEVQPEVYEVECGWQADHGDGVSPFGKEGDELSGKWSTLIGKRTKVTIEVIPG